jgi:hypothetical protein
MYKNTICIDIKNIYIVYFTVVYIFKSINYVTS